MEDATDFLKMAGSILLFVVALSVIIPMFSRARQTIDSLIRYSDRESEFYDGYAYMDGTEGEDAYFYNSGNNKVRNVGLDTIIPAIYRSYDENYRIVFMYGNLSMNPSAEPGSKEFFNNLNNLNFYKILKESKDEHGIITSEFKDSNVFDLHDFSISKEGVNEVIEGFLYGKFKNYAHNTPQNGFQSVQNIEFNEKFIKGNPKPYKEGKGLYHYLKKFLEEGIRQYI